MGLDENLNPKSPPYPGGRAHAHLEARAAASCRAPASCIAIATRSMQPLLYCAKNAYNLVTRRREATFYPDEIEIQEAHSKHRKLDSQATLSHRARGRAPDGLRSPVRPLRASRRDHDPGRLSPWSPGLGGVRPAMAADRAIRGPPARSPCQERDCQRTSDPR